MAMPYKKDNALYSPTSAWEKIRMLSHLGEGRGTEKISLTDSDKLIVLALTRGLGMYIKRQIYIIAIIPATINHLVESAICCFS
jgi:hypothetical protein